MIITVTKEHIKEGVRKNCRICPVALAIRQHLPSCSSVALGIYEVIGVDKDGDDFEIPLPDNVSEWICAFDDGATVEPFFFILDTTGIAI